MRFLIFSILFFFMGVTNTQNTESTEPSVEEISVACSYLAVWEESVLCESELNGTKSYSEVKAECLQRVESKLPSTPLTEITILDQTIVSVVSCPSDVGDCEDLKKQGFAEYLCTQWRQQNLNCKLHYVRSAQSEFCK